MFGLDGADERLGEGGRRGAVADFPRQLGPGLVGRVLAERGEEVGRVGLVVVHVAHVLVGPDLRAGEEGRQVVADAGMAVERRDEEDAGDVGELRGADRVGLALEEPQDRRTDAVGERLHRPIDVRLGPALAERRGERGEVDLRGLVEKGVQVEVAHLVLREEPFPELPLRGVREREPVAFCEDGGALVGEALRHVAERLLDLLRGVGGQIPPAEAVRDAGGELADARPGQGVPAERGGGDAGPGGELRADHRAELRLAGLDGGGAAQLGVHPVQDGVERRRDVLRRAAGRQAADEVGIAALERVDRGGRRGLAGEIQLGEPGFDARGERPVRRRLGGGRPERVPHRLGGEAVPALRAGQALDGLGRDEQPDRRVRRDDGRAEDGADVREDVGGERPVLAEESFVGVDEGRDDLVVEGLGRSRRDVGQVRPPPVVRQVARHVKALAGPLRRRAFRQGGELAQERCRGRVRQAVREREARVVVHARVLQERDAQGPDLVGRLVAAVPDQGVDPSGALLARDGAEGGAQLDRVRAGAEAGETDDHVLQPAGERRLVRPRLHREAPLPVRAPGDLRRAVRARMAVREVENDAERLLRHLEQLGAVGLRPEVDVAREERLEEGEPALRLDRAALREPGVGRVALGDAPPARVGADAGVDLRARADRHLVLACVERLCVAVEDLADLLARERPEAALHQLRVHGLLRRQAELRADLGDLVRLDAAPRERVHERLLDRDHLGVGKRHLVPAGAGDVVVDLVDRVRVLEADLAGVVPAGGDVLELLEADRDVGELDGEGHGGDSVTSDE